MDRQVHPKGSITNLFIKPAHGAPMKPIDTLQAVSGKGIEGDQAYGRKSRQVLIVDQKMLEILNLAPGDLRENITVQGVSIDSLQSGTLLQAGEVVLKIVDICDPCKKLEGIRPGLMQAAVGMRGMLAVVKHGGQLHEGAPVMIIEEQ